MKIKLDTHNRYVDTNCITTGNVRENQIEKGTKMKTYEIEKGTEVLETTKREIGIGTNDDQPNRYLMHGIEADGGHVIWMETEGGPSYLPCADLDELEMWLRNLADNTCDTAWQRPQQGLERLQEAVGIVRGWYEHNAAAQEALDWIDDEVDDYVRLILDLFEE